MNRRFNSILVAWACIMSAAWAEQVAAQEEWNRQLAAARKEGKAVLGTEIGVPAFRQEIVGAFAKRFGFDLELRLVGGAELSAVAGRECAAGRPSIDVLLGGNRELITLLPKGCLAPIKPALILPEVTNPKNWRGGYLKFNDPEEKYVLQTAEFASFGRVLINTDHVKPQEITSVKDLLKPEYRGKIAGYDPRNPGAGQATATYLLMVFGEELIRKLYVEQKITYTTDHRQLAEWVARGTYPIGLAAQERGFDRFLDEGLPLKVYNSLSDAPGYLIGGSSVIKLVKGAPHPGGAMVLVNWFASKEGQEIYSRTVLQPSRRVDVTVKEIPDYHIPKPGVNYQDTYSYDFYVNKRPEVTKLLLKLLGR
jgi:ABC-type Fe3+ transport system substrate-binding protein